MEERRSRNRTILVAALVILGGLLPPALYGLTLGFVPTVTATEARTLLEPPAFNTILIDVRPPEAFEKNHVRGATNLPCEFIAGMTARSTFPPSWKGKRLLIVCETGLLSAYATWKLHDIGAGDVANVRGGMQALVADRAAGRPSPLYEQWAAVLTGFAVKPFYMAVTLGLVVFLWRRTRPELVALRWGLLCFFIGETFCAVNYLSFNDESYLSEFLHSYGMALCFGFVTWAFFEGMDRWLIRYSDLKETCAALPLCRACVKYAAVPCGLRRMFYLLIPATMVLAGMPLVAGFSTVSYNTLILGTPYNYSHPVLYQIYEYRLLPAAALGLMALSLAALALKKQNAVEWSKLLFAAGMGALGFSLLRLFIYAPYAENQVWFAFWEEITELLFIVGVVAVLWIFRKGLLAKTEAA
jgi:rhodanese-related sulfurtransferase